MPAIITAAKVARTIQNKGSAPDAAGGEIALPVCHAARSGMELMTPSPIGTSFADSHHRTIDARRRVTRVTRASVAVRQATRWRDIDDSFSRAATLLRV
jgi:hypothetical protein